MILELIIACIVITVMVGAANWILGDLRVYFGLMASHGIGNSKGDGNGLGSGAADGERNLPGSGSSGSGSGSESDGSGIGVVRDKIAGDAVTTAGQCINSTAALWSTHGPEFGMKCCRGPNVVTANGVTFCTDLNIDDPCNLNNQCKSGKCGQFNTCVIQTGMITGKTIRVCRVDNAIVPINLLGIDVFDQHGNRIITGIDAESSDGNNPQPGLGFLIDGMHTELDSDGRVRAATSSANANAYLGLKLNENTVISKIVIYNRTVGQTETRINGCILVVTDEAGKEVFNMPLSDKTDIITFQAPFPLPEVNITCDSIVLYNATREAGYKIRVWDMYDMEITSGVYEYFSNGGNFIKLVLEEDTTISRIQVKNTESEYTNLINGTVLVARNAAGVGVFISDPLQGSLGEYEYKQPFAAMTAARSALLSEFDPGVMIRWRDTGKCVDVSRGENKNGTWFQVYNCIDTEKNQRFKFENGQVKWGRSGKCLGVKDGKNENGTTLHLWECSANTKDQQFTFAGTQIRWGKSGKCVDVKENWDRNGQPLHLWDCGETNAAQMFKISK